MTTPTSAAAAIADKRFDFIKDLYSLAAQRESPIPQRAANAHRVLAHLRRGLAGERQQVDAYERVFRHDPPLREAPTWLLIAGLFALHPQHTSLSANTTFGTPMGRMARDRKDSVTRRFTQLLGQNPDALPHYLRQCVQLAAQADEAVDYRRLLDDVLILTGPHHRDAPAHDVRLRWIRDFHRNAESRNQHATGTSADAGTSDGNNVTDAQETSK